MCIRDSAQAALQVVLTRTHFELFTGSPALVGLALAGLAGLAWFGWHQWHHPAPLVRLHALRQPGFRVGLALYVVYYYLSTGFSYLLPRLMEGGLGFSVGNTGYFTGAMSLATGLLVFVYLRYSARLARKKWLIVAGFAISFATSSVIALQQHRLALHETRLAESANPGNAGFMRRSTG